MQGEARVAPQVGELHRAGHAGQPRLTGDELHLDPADPGRAVGAQGGEELVRVRVEGGAHARGELRLLGLDVGEGGHAGMLHPATDEAHGACSGGPAPSGGSGRRPRSAGARAPCARSLPITMRWIWLVPSKICMTFASRM